MSSERARTHPPVHPAIADGETVVLPADPGPRLDDRARSAGQTWIGWQPNLLPGDVSGDRIDRDEAERRAIVAARAARRRADPRTGRRRGHAGSPGTVPSTPPHAPWGADEPSGH